MQSELLVSMDLVGFAMIVICCIDFYPVQQISVYMLPIRFLVLNDIEAWLIFQWLLKKQLGGTKWYQSWQLTLANNTFCKIGNSYISILVFLKPWLCFSIWQCVCIMTLKDNDFLGGFWGMVAVGLFAKEDKMEGFSS